MKRMKFKLFGWYVFISRRPMKVQDRHGKSRSERRDKCREMRLEIANNRCKICGKPIDSRCSLHHLLNVGEPDRNAVENVLVLYSHCHHELERRSHYHGIKHLDDVTRYDCES